MAHFLSIKRSSILANVIIEFAGGFHSWTTSAVFFRSAAVCTTSALFFQSTTVEAIYGQSQKSVHSPTFQLHEASSFAGYKRLADHWENGSGTSSLQVAKRQGKYPPCLLR